MVSKREIIARHRLNQIINATPTRKRSALRARLGSSLGYTGSVKNRRDQITNLTAGRRTKLTSKRITTINSWYRRRALGQVRNTDVPNVKYNEYFILNDSERINLAGYHVETIENQIDPNVWTLPPPPQLIINTIAHIRAFSFAAIEYGGQAIIGARFMIPWGDNLRTVVGTNINKLFTKFNGAIFDAFESPPPTGGYRILELAFSDLGASWVEIKYDAPVDARGYGIFLESRQKKKGEVYKLRTVNF